MSYGPRWRIPALPWIEGLQPGRSAHAPLTPSLGGRSQARRMRIGAPSTVLTCRPGMDFRKASSSTDEIQSRAPETPVDSPAAPLRPGDPPTFLVGLNRLW